MISSKSGIICCPDSPNYQIPKTVEALLAPPQHWWFFMALSVETNDLLLLNRTKAIKQATSQIEMPHLQ